MQLAPMLDDAVARGAIVGAVAMVGNAGGITNAAAAGLANRTLGLEMNIETIFQIASMTKAITSVAALQLVEQGKLALDAPIAAVLPPLADAQVITGFAEDGKATLRPAARPITLRHLLTHTSGLGYSFMSAEMARAQGEVAPGTIAAITSPLLFDPGERWEYGVSTDWVGRAIEAVTGTSLGAYFRDAIFAPLGMDDTMFDATPEQRERRAELYARLPDGGFVPFPIEMGGGAAAEFQSGGGGLMSTAGDYMRFMRMILNHGTLDGEQVLAAETVAMMTRDQVAPLRAGAMRTVMPQFAREFDTFPDMHTGWGLGFLINPQRAPNGRAAGSLTWAGIANTYYWIDPASNIAAVVMMQVLPFADPDALALVGAIERSIYGL